MDVVFGSLLLFSTIAYDSILRISPPKSLQSAIDRVSAPFFNFLTLEDIDGPLGPVAKSSRVKSRALVALAALEVSIWLSIVVHVLVSSESFVHTIRPVLWCLAWMYTAFRIAIIPPLTPPYFSVLFGSVQAFNSLLHFLLNLADFRVETFLDLLHLSITTGFVWLAGTLPLQLVKVAPNIAKSTDIPSSNLSCPEDDVTLWSWSTFAFVEPILNLANSQTVNDDNVWLLSPYFRHKSLFNKYLQYMSQHPAHSLLRFLLVSNSLDLIIDIVLELWSVFVGFVPPYALQEILSALAVNTSESRRTAYYWCFITFLAHLSFAQKDLFQSWHTRRCYERTRGQLFCGLHYKSLKRQDISGKSNDEPENSSADLGKIVNLMQGDSYAVSQRFWEFSAIFTSPIRLIIALIFLYNVLGWSAIFGVVVVLVAYVLNYPLAKYNIGITRSAWKAKDARMNVVNELLQNVRFLKFYGWENHWAEKSEKAREIELGWRIKENVVDTLISFIWTWIPSATALSTFFCYTIIAGEQLTVSKAFTAIALFTQLQGPMTALPGQFFAMLHAYVSMQRIEHFLLEEEVPDWACSLKAHPGPREDKLGFEEGIFQWQAVPKSTLPGSPLFRLGPLNIIFPSGKISLVTGATGSGKTALLSALLGEMNCVSGKVYLDKQFHSVAYCAQNPWLEHATIRDNIIFSSAYGFDPDRYRAVIYSCALQRDLEVFDAGDLTEIGEKGITLSGGQRARVALARAIYSEAKCILLDDPLAAVDMHTAQHIVNECLSGPLIQDRTVILVTHHVNLCIPIAAYLVEVNRGSVIRHGTIDTLSKTDLLQLGEASEEETFADPDETLEPHAIENEADIGVASGVHTSIDDANTANGKLIAEEARAEGNVSLKTYMTYIWAAGMVSWVLTVFLMILIRGINILAQVFLAAWGDAYEIKILQTLQLHLPWEGYPSPDENVLPWLMVYLWISIAGASTVLFYIALGYYASLQASRSLFVSLLRRITRAPARFFDVTPIGRILNRFTSDINTIDGALQNSVRQCLLGILNFLASFIVILVVVPTFAPFALFIAWLYIRLAPSYVKASRDLRRLESVSLSPAFAGFDELLRGITHVRAFGMEQRYQDNFYRKVDKFQKFDHVYWLVNGWLRWRYDCLGSVVVFATTLFALWMRKNDGVTAIVIVQSGIFAEASRQLVKVAAQLELDFNSVERVTEYFDLPQEAPAIISGHRPPAYWPSSSGSLIVRDLEVRYAPGLPAVLKRLSFTVNPSEKIGVVGRTGSGKSTLALSLLRMVEPVNGGIIVDGIDISSIGLDDLRSRVTIVSQDVSLFTGTLRSNLDPLEICSDEECLDVMKRCHLDKIIGTSDLHMRVNSGSLSGGERQLVALARAILRRTNIIIMDEATSQIDTILDDQIQTTIREELSSAIVITIAHRLRTIIDYDRILVLDQGDILEFGTPKELLSNVDGAFRMMCYMSTDWNDFKKIAE